MSGKLQRDNMAIFGNLILEEALQIGDKTRLDAGKSFTVSEAAISLVEIEPEASAGFETVSSTDKFLDWQYTGASRTVVVSVRITTDGAPVTTTASLILLTDVDDKLFSGDAELRPFEPNILDWVKAGRNSFLDVHRASQDRILTQLDEDRVWDSNGDRLTKASITDIQEVNDWSKFMTLRLIFEGLSNATDDIHHIKGLRYLDMEKQAKSRAGLRLDRDGDGTTDDLPTQLTNFRLQRR